MAKKAKKAKKKSAKKAKRSSAKRDLVKGRNATMYAKRSGKGRFKEIDEQGRSQQADRRTKAKRRTKSGYGDQGDR
ncbi:MAG TPA: hypothetical protein VM096_18815 [Vicinamibacterales bacterium]|nr:hypothetical protein [Vicinamibacterales bacterium]